MKNYSLKFKKLTTLTFLFFALSFSFVFAQVLTPSKVRVTYRPDGGVSVTSFAAGACQGGETETECMDRIMEKNPELANLPHDDILSSELPQDRKDRDKWRGSKGQGVWVDHSLVTKGEKIEELTQKLDEELDKNNPNSIKIAKLQRLIEKVKDYRAEYGLIKPEDLSKFEDKKQSILATISSAFESLLTSIQNGLLSIKELVIGLR